MIIKEIRSFEGYDGFISGLAEHPLYSDPHFSYSKENLYSSLKRKDEYAYSVSENGKTVGLFVWLVVPADRYIEMIIGFTEKEEAFEEMLSYMERKYRGYVMDFVFNPLNSAVSRPLKARGAIFEPEQQKMILNGSGPDVPTDGIELLSEKRIGQYCGIHSTNTYWTAERILSAPDKFRVLLAVENGRVQGYLDVQSGCEVNEIYDLYIKPEAAQQGCKTALLAKAIELNKPNKMMVAVDADAGAEIDFYTAAGFVRLEGQNSVFASYRS